MWAGASIHAGCACAYSHNGSKAKSDDEWTKEAPSDFLEYSRLMGGFCSHTVRKQPALLLRESVRAGRRLMVEYFATCHILELPFLKSCRSFLDRRRYSSVPVPRTPLFLAASLGLVPRDTLIPTHEPLLLLSQRFSSNRV
jgi:hypothetical protein